MRTYPSALKFVLALCIVLIAAVSVGILTFVIVMEAFAWLGI